MFEAPRVAMLFALVSAVAVAPIAAGTSLCDPTLIFADGFESANTVGWNPSPTLATARAAPDGPTSINVAGVQVTYVVPAVGSDPAGFFVQAATLGPALFVAVDPLLLSPVPVAGDGVYFTIDEMATVDQQRRATAISAFGRSQQSLCLDRLVQEVSGASDLTTNLDSYDSEALALSGTLVSSFFTSGIDHVEAEVDTAGITGDPDLQLRVPTTLKDALDLVPDCSFDLLGTPLWRFDSTAQLSAWRAEDLSITSCPAPRVLSAAATSPTSVAISFDRHIDPASITGAGGQFLFDGGLAATGAAVAGRTVTVTTTAQTGGTVYTVTVDGTVTDTVGSGVDAGADQAAFEGYQTPATAVINELNANISGSCDLVELRVISGGTLSGFHLFERTIGVVAFAGLHVASGDLVVIHFNGSSTTCNPNASASETSAKDQFPNAVFPENYDTAWDWYTTDSGITNTNNVLTLYDALGTIVDAVFAANDSTCTTASSTDDQAAVVADAGEWQQVGGGVPAGGFVDDAFCQNAALDLNATGTEPTGETIHRISDVDTDTKQDWAQGSQSWGALNSGESPP